ncbi:MAG: NADH-quinone oxidoreductase subunit L [Pyrinomonadaceae bacterium]
MLSLIIFAPLVGALINWIVGRRLRSEAFSGIVACSAVGVSTVVAFILAFKDGGALRIEEPIFDHIWTWMEVGGFRADFGLAMDRLSGIYALFITFVGLLIHIFATGYMHGDKGFYRFFAYLNLFMFSMLTLILADNFLLMFVGWEGVGLCSYLLIGYYTDREEAGDAAKKAFVANRIGDWGVILGVMLIYALTGSIGFFDKPAMDGMPALPSALNLIAAMPAESLAAGTIIAGGITSIAVLLFIGATGKSAQIPLFVWLPDAMAGPTPVSALIHAATMVTAGVYMIVRCNGIYSNAPTAMLIVAVIGAATAIFAATIGLAQNDIKKVLAYSTVSQLGYMMLACGVGAYVAAIFHVMTHAFFKALLFLGSGSVIHGMHHEQDMRRMGGLRKYMPITFISMLMGWLAICGIPIWAGFFSKDEILWKTWSTAVPGVPGRLLWVVGAVTALLTAVYMTRLMLMTFGGTDRFREAHAGGQADEAHAHAFDEGHKPHDARADSTGDRAHHQAGDHSGGAHTPHESPLVMTLPLIILAILSTLGGLVGVPYALSSIVGIGDANYFEHVLEPVIARKDSSHAVIATEGAHDSHAGAPAAIAEAHGETAEAHGSGTTAATVPAATHGAAAGAHHSAEEVSAERLFTGISMGIAIAGILGGVLLFGSTPLRAMPRLLENKYYVDEIYDATLINPTKVISREGLWKFFDVRVIDGLVNGAGWLASAFGSALRYLQPGLVRSYAAIILFGALMVIGYFAYYSVSFSR